MATRITTAVQLNFGANSSPFGTENAVILTTTQSIVLSQGVWMVSFPASAVGNVQVEYSPDSGTTWRPVARKAVTAGDAGVSAIYSDGFNVRITQDTTAATASTYYTLVRASF